MDLSDQRQRACAGNLGFVMTYDLWEDRNRLKRSWLYPTSFYLPSDYESFGLAALEAMAAGVPVISTNAGGLPEINIQGKTGFLSNVGNVKEMSSNAISLLQDDNFLEIFKKKAREQADKFDITNMIPQYEALYDRFLNKGAAIEMEKTKIA